MVEGGNVKTPKKGDVVKGFGHKYLTPIIEVNEKNKTFKIDSPNYWDYSSVLISFDKVVYNDDDNEWVKKMAKGGMMEHGLRIGDKVTTDMFWDNQIVVENTKTHKRAQIDLETGKRKDEMAKGGEITPYIIWVSKDGEKRELFGNYKSKRAADMQMNKLWEKGEYKSMGNKPKSMYEKEGFYGEGGQVKYPTDLKVGSVIKGVGFPMLKGIDGDKYYKVVEVDDISATFVVTDAQGKKTGTKKTRHKLSSIDSGIKTASRGDNNGIEVVKYAMGGGVTFDDKVKAIKASLLKTKKVPKKVQKDYGKTYNAKEAELAAKRIAGSIRKKGMK